RVLPRRARRPLEAVRTRRGPAPPLLRSAAAQPRRRTPVLPTTPCCTSVAPPPVAAPLKTMFSHSRSHLNAARRLGVAPPICNMAGTDGEPVGSVDLGRWCLLGGKRECIAFGGGAFFLVWRAANQADEHYGDGGPDEGTEDVHPPAGEVVRHDVGPEGAGRVH